MLIFLTDRTTVSTFLTMEETLFFTSSTHLTVILELTKNLHNERYRLPWLVHFHIAYILSMQTIQTLNCIQRISTMAIAIFRKLNI
jgi:hypothetical protein